MTQELIEPRCQCPMRSTDHEACACENNYGLQLVRDPVTGFEGYVCPMCVLSDYEKLGEKGEDAND